MNNKSLVFLLVAFCGIFCFIASVILCLIFYLTGCIPESCNGSQTCLNIKDSSSFVLVVTILITMLFNLTSFVLAYIGKELRSYVLFGTLTTNFLSLVSCTFYLLFANLQDKLFLYIGLPFYAMALFFSTITIIGTASSAKKQTIENNPRTRIPFVK